MYDPRMPEDLQLLVFQIDRDSIKEDIMKKCWNTKREIGENRRNYKRINILNMNLNKIQIIGNVTKDQK